MLSPSMLSPSKSSLALTCLGLALGICVLFVACGQEAPEPPPAPAAPQRVENPEAGLALTDVPDGWRLVSNQGAEIVLERKPQLPPGTATVAATEEQQAGVNLVDAVNEQKAEIEQRPEGRFQGQTELRGPLGTAFLTRGRWSNEGTDWEELRIFSLHPGGNRMVVLTYDYALTGDTKDRAEQVMELLAYVEGLATAATTPEATPEETP